LTARKAPFVEENSGKSPETPAQSPGAWMLPGGMSAMKNCDRYNKGLITLSCEFIVRFISLLSLFDRTQGPDYGGKFGQVT
jgi:hypothetical protein